MTVLPYVGVAGVLAGVYRRARRPFKIAQMAAGRKLAGPVMQAIFHPYSAAIPADRLMFPLPWRLILYIITSSIAAFAKCKDF